MDMNLIAAVCSMITPTILPYILNLDSCRDIWLTIERLLQASNRSRIIQLKNEIHNVSLKHLSMIQYLTTIKTLVDNIITVGSMSIQKIYFSIP
ncbi:hypothetical protein M5K25_006322 [Dendrobium thyrsiflorum]|uniref:Retrovirus-related Pol polyprotein from transposon TNT 1-94 n=1 Tax=Dendrobium thyrsiflorum TaxID=117978 RepID=A0ABD0VB94_DENTH